MKKFKQSIINIAESCAQNQVLNFILSPGSRSAPLALAFLRHPKLTCRTMVDERSAAFIALGIAQQIGLPVGLVCTSGTAGLNYGPAIAEAFYQQIPLLIFTADRPPEWIDQYDGQTINQREMFGKHCRASYELPTDDVHPDAKWQMERIISEAINTSLWPIPGPVHINVPLREPLYPESEFNYQENSKIINLTPTQNILQEDIWNELVNIWNTSIKKLIVAGMHNPDTKLSECLDYLQQHKTVAIIFDVTANLHDSQKIHHSDMILGTDSVEKLQQLAPDLLITFGGPVVSKNLKLFLRKYKPKVHWQIQSFSQCIDTFQSLTRIIPVSTDYFFENMVKRILKENIDTGFEPPDNNYRAFWTRQEIKAQMALQEFLRDIPHCEFSTMDAILKALPQESHLQLGNSFIIRLANFIGLSATKGIQVNSNRGTNGIEGTVGTTVGAALTTKKITTLITGDLAFFYDRNSLWHDYLPTNLRIIIINNFGGGIFRILDGARELPELAKHFEVEHKLTAKNTAHDFGLNYTLCVDGNSLQEKLSEFFEPQKKPALLEIQTNKLTNTDTFYRFISIMREIK
ncbi:MAG: 2-succinyl-5-enolpyruvyl-6-hydroxy-3-cyclohexene-1-carboxylic-acid synthase [bacterium]